MRLEAPFTEEKIRALKVGDLVEISGLIFTGRDAVHKHLHEGNDSPVDLRDGIIYHCGPVVVQERGGWVLVDYKTDRIKDRADLHTLSGKYAPQLRQYKEAWERCTGEQVTESGFLFTNAGEGAGGYVRVDA